VCPQLVGSSSQCLNGQRHDLSYTASTGDNHFVDLDGSDFTGLLSGVTCDVDHTELTLSFNHRADTLIWLAKFHDFSQHFIVGGKQWNCTTHPKAARPDYILRRVYAASESAHLGRDLIIRTSLARYDEVFETADISYGVSSNDAKCTALHAAELAATQSKHVCIGANTDCQGHAKGPLPLYTSASGDLSATCTDCFASLSADLFLTVNIDGFKLNKLSAGFTNTTVDAHLAIDASAKKSTTLALSKNLEILKQTYLLDFKVGVVPFMLFLEVPMSVNAELDFSANADLTFGAVAGLNLGEVSISWDPTNHWTHTQPKLSYALTPSLSSSAMLDVVGDLALVPTFQLHFDRMFSYELVAHPKLHAHVSGTEATKQVCLDATYDMDLVASADLDININLIDFHKDWNYGPKTVGTWSGEPVPNKCVPV
jgi:hypothetical protein